MRKVFCIGFHKTGTTSLHRALSQLGYRVCGLRKDLVAPLLSGDPAPIREAVRAFDAFEDNPWPLLFRQLDEAVPGSRFILTLREEDAWWASVLRHFGGRSSAMRQLVYGADAGDPRGREAVYRARYRRHLAEVRGHFAGRADLLEIDLARGDGWGALCGFLGHPVPDAPFPHANRAVDLARLP